MVDRYLLTDVIIKGQWVEGAGDLLTPATNADHGDVLLEATMVIPALTAVDVVSWSVMSWWSSLVPLVITQTFATLSNS